MVGIMNLLRMAECSPVSSLGDENPAELYLVNHKLKSDLQCCMVGKGLK